MGLKRPIEEENYNEFPLKHPKQVNFGNDLTSFSQSFPSMEETQKTDIPGKNDHMYFKIQYDDDDSDDSKEDIGSHPSYFSPFSPEFVDFHFPRRLVPQFKDTYSCLLESLPRKQVPIGTDYQALVPGWDPQAIVDDSNDKFLSENVHHLLDQSDDEAFHARISCTCPDEGSIRCVQQHVKEAREALRAVFGDEKFAKLGFCDMGEDVSEYWSEEEQRIFHEVVYSKSVSHGKDFWDNLSTVFPYRKKSEIVSFYFNVFILRRRSVQNRSNDLDIDSDDDDWDESYWCPLGFEQEVEDLVRGSPHPIAEADCPINDDVDENDGKKDYKVEADENGGGSTFGWDPGFMSCKGKAWDDYFSISPLKFADHPPTGNMMDDIFGPCPKDNGPFL